MRLEGFNPIQQAAFHGFADNLDIFLLCQNVFEPPPEEAMSIRDKYRDQIHRVHCAQKAILHTRAFDAAPP
jgi:hypothetical protein